MEELPRDALNLRMADLPVGIAIRTFSTGLVASLETNNQLVLDTLLKSGMTLWSALIARRRVFIHIVAGTHRRAIGFTVQGGGNTAMFPYGAGASDIAEKCVIGGRVGCRKGH